MVRGFCVEGGLTVRADDCESTGAGISKTEAGTGIRVLEEKVESDKRTLLEEELYIKRNRSCDD